MTHSQPTSHKTREYAGHKWLVLALTAFFAIALLVPSQFAADIDAQAFQKAEGISPVILEEALEPPAGHDAG